MNRLPLSTIFFYRFLSTVTQSKRSSIGFLGLGAMGYPMAMNVLKNHQIKNNETGADHQTEIFVLDIAPDRSDQLIQEFYSQNKDLKIKISIKSTNSIVDLASKCNIIITMLPNTDHVLETITGLNGILRNTKKGTLIIDCSTIDPTTSKVNFAILMSITVVRIVIIQTFVVIAIIVTTPYLSSTCLNPYPDRTSVS